MNGLRHRVRKLMAWGACTLLILPGSLLNAHHASAPFYDSSREVEVEGEITEVLWQNPHIRFTLRDDEGRDWDIETTSVSILSRWGLDEDVVEIGPLDRRYDRRGSAGRCRRRPGTRPVPGLDQRRTAVEQRIPVDGIRADRARRMGPCCR